MTALASGPFGSRRLKYFRTNFTALGSGPTWPGGTAWIHLYKGPRKGRRSSSASVTNIHLPSPCSITLMDVYPASSWASVQFASHLRRDSLMLMVKCLWSIQSPHHSYSGPPLNFFQVRGVPAATHIKMTKTSVSKQRGSPTSTHQSKSSA